MHDRGGRLITMLISVAERSDFGPQDLADRFEHAPSGPITEHFKFVVDGTDVAFIAIDWWNGKPYAVLYELFVTASHRARGIGSAALLAVEALVRSRGRSSLHVVARPLDGSQTSADLREWYQRRGFQRVPGDDDELFGKDLSAPSKRSE